MKIPRSFILILLLGACSHATEAQEVTPLGTTNTIPAAAVAPTGEGLPPPAGPTVTLNKPLPAKKDDRYHLDTGIGYRRPWNGDYDWLTLATLSFGKMLDERNALDAVLKGGVIELNSGGTADAQAHQPFFVELGVAWQHYFARPDASLKPYVAVSASVLWMSWKYRTPVNSKDYGLITRDYLEGGDGYAGVGLNLRLRKHLNLFGEVDAGGVGFLPTTYSGDHNNLFANFGYVGVRGGLSLTF